MTNNFTKIQIRKDDKFNFDLLKSNIESLSPYQGWPASLSQPQFINWLLWAGWQKFYEIKKQQEQPDNAS